MSSESKCPLCDSSAEEGLSASRMMIKYYECPVCGRFALDRFIVDKSERFSEGDRHKAAFLLVEKRLRGAGPYYIQDLDAVEKVDGLSYIPVTLKDFLKQYPQSGLEVFDHILINLSYLMPSATDSIDLGDYSQKEEYKWYFHCADSEHLGQVRDLMAELGYLRPVDKFNWCIGIRGWERLQEMQKDFQSGAAFMAMWFDDETKPLRSAVRDAVRQAGYNPEELTVDESHHNDYIMDKVVNMIDDARFVIADFTCMPEENGTKGVRGGVYFEAGFARGRDKQVIHTCRDDDEAKRRLHFDVGQINTIFWRDEIGTIKAGEHDFVDVLRERIIATVGKGPYWRTTNEF